MENKSSSSHTPEQPTPQRKSYTTIRYHSRRIAEKVTFLYYPLRNTPDHFTYRAAILAQSHIYLVGGLIRDVASSQVDCFAAGTDHKEIVRKASLRVPRYSTVLVLLAERNICALGGHELNSCECYDIAKDRWSPLPSLRLVGYLMSACVFHQRFVYTVGSAANFRMGARRPLEQLDFLDPESGWRFIQVAYPTDMYGPRHLGGDIYVVGNTQLIVLGTFECKLSSRN